MFDYGYIPVIPMFIGIVIILIFIIIFLRFFPIGLWVTALFSGVRINMITLITMRLRRVNPSLIVLNQIKLWKAGLKIGSNELEAHYLAGGNPTAVADALIAADKASLDLSFERAAAIDLAGRDLVDAIRTSVSPRVIATPLIAAVAKDGIQVKATARVTVRTNINRLVGGAGEETIIARVGEGIVTTIGSSASHKEVLENPDRISQVVLAKGLDSGTAFEILSIDIADVDVGSNIGAFLQIDQAEADKKIAQAKAEERRVMAIAREQEMRAQVEEMKAKVVEAESQLPLAIAEALKKGNIGVLDYYNMKNVMADTEMRYSISGMDSMSKNSNSSGNVKQ
ncbi:flotillin-like protein FloA [Brachyspira hyodysenteriae]|uniref:flotillin-like protein FloA n=1 Tax=Brachyspira hyodysenteriae TaxID=159 RepID=UPI001ADDCE52|nr:flotillin-like protein FloA [Brachyspira hyodysenteriae]MDA0081883.1 flotillin-like protein FloA [Brachyspira hyodysenteriae]QTM09731.1 flotillin-like protein FloA [Brachyspira hyodysenteriae]